MQIDRFVEQRRDAWRELEDLLKRSRSRPERLRPAELRRAAALYRAAAADLAFATRSWPDAAGTSRLRGIVTRAHALVYAKASREATAREYLGRLLWERIAGMGGCLGLSAAVLLGSLALGVVWASLAPASAVGLLPAGARVVAHNKGGFYGVGLAGRAGLVSVIFVNNLRVSVIVLAGGLTAGIVTTYFLGYNGLLVGVLGGLEWRAGGAGSFLSLVLPHGLLELSCVTVAGAGGYMIARALVDPGRLTRVEALERGLPTLTAVVLTVALFLLVAATTEGIVTPWDLPTGWALAVGLVLGGGFWAMVLFRGAIGRRRPQRDERQRFFTAGRAVSA